MGAPGYDNGFNLSLLPERLSQPLQRRKPTMYFVNSMSDLFQDDVPFEFVDKVMQVIEQTPWHTYQILTKRSALMREYFETHQGARTTPGWASPLKIRNLASRAYQHLQAIKAKTRFLSVEPLLGRS